jgi:hypothetical protein
MRMFKNPLAALVLALLLVIPLLFMLANRIGLGGRERPPGIAGTGICYDQPAQPAAISREQAIEAARSSLPPERKSNLVTAEYVLYSNDMCNAYQDPGEFTKVPAWIVTFHDVKITEGGGTTFTENHVAVHAQNGEVVNEFRYR